MLRTMIKILLFPVTIILALTGWLCSAAADISGILFRLIAGTFILCAFLSYGFGLEPWFVALQMILGGIIFFALPLIAAVLAAAIFFLNTLLRTI